MTITDNSTYKYIDENLEQHTFPSEVNPAQKHYIDRCDGNEWKLDIVQLEDSLSREEVVTLMHELTELLAFMDKLNRPAPRRTTEPGSPAFEEGI